MQRDRERGSEPSTGKNERDSESIENPFDYFARPQSRDFDLFFQYYPKPTPQRVIPNVFHSKDGTNRKWLTYNEVTHYLFLHLQNLQPVTWKHAHQRVQEHERPTEKVHQPFSSEPGKQTPVPF